MPSCAGGSKRQGRASPGPEKRGSAAVSAGYMAKRLGTTRGHRRIRLDGRVLLHLFRHA